MFEIQIKKKLGEISLNANLEDSGSVCVSGRNGSGKSSLLLCVSGWYQPDEGYVKVNGVDVTHLEPSKRGVVLLDSSSYFPTLEVDTHLQWGARTRGFRPDPARLSQVKAELGIDFGGKVGKLSQGQKLRVSVATALLSSQRLILVDEAFSSIDDRREFVNRFKKLAREMGVDVIYATPIQEDEEMFDHCYRIEKGQTSRVY